MDVLDIFNLTTNQAERLSLSQFTLGLFYIFLINH